MFKNLYFDRFKNVIHLWEQINGENLYSKIDWVPYVYVKTSSSNIHSIDGVPVKKVEFNTYKEYQDFCQGNKTAYENQMLPDIQFLAERYYSIPSEEMSVPKLKIYSIDIETTIGVDGIDAIKAEQTIVLISIYDFGSCQSYTFGLKPYAGLNPFKTKYHQCSDEKDLLFQFLKFWKNNYPDVVTGWNILADNKVNPIGGFDLPYLFNRLVKITGDIKALKFLSPIGIINFKNFEDVENPTTFIEIAGISIVDYQSLYKWFSKQNRKNLEAYSLDRVAIEETGSGKLKSSEFDDLKEFMEKDWNGFVDYNVMDNILVKKINDSVGYLSLAQHLSLLCKCPLNKYNVSTRLVEGLMLTRLRRFDKCAPRFVKEHSEDYEGALVKEPVPGMHEWLFSLDITSSYPFAIITLNMSPETVFGKIQSDLSGTPFSENEIMTFTRNRKFPPFILDKKSELVEMVDVGKTNKLTLFNKSLSSKLLSIAPNGSVFYTKPEGMYAKMEKDIFLKRKEVRDKIDILKKDKDKSHKDEIFKLNMLQQALKIVLNAAYGATAVNYFRYFSQEMAEAVTAVGRESLRSGEKYANEILNNPSKEMLEVLNEV